MKKIVIVFCLITCFNSLSAQVNESENEIRKLEQLEVTAVLNKDTNTLKLLWDNAYIVNNPENKIILAKPNPVDRPVLQNTILAFDRVVERVVINDEVAVSMGNEKVRSIQAGTNNEQLVERRYSNIWLKKNGSWKLIARHANKICPVAN